MAIDGPSSPCIKADWYDLLYTHNSLVTVRTKHIHGPRRRQWTRAFNASGTNSFHGHFPQ
jgi:tryprostatin B 6-hydroxylase